MPDGTMPAPGGWNRFSIEVTDLHGTVDRLRAAGVRFRNDIVTGVGGDQILVEDPSGNPVALSSRRAPKPGSTRPAERRDLRLRGEASSTAPDRTRLPWLPCVG
jgi:hypothetical protein